MTGEDIRLSRTLSFILRHDPGQFGLQIAADASLPLGELVAALKERGFVNLTRKRVIDVVKNDPKGRYSLLDDNRRIRANYGHSIEGVHPDYRRANPPQLLYHGTARRFKESIMKEGLKSGQRNFVHLTSDFKEAQRVGKRRDPKPLILKIRAGTAAREGKDFYHCGHKTYLTELIEPEYINCLKL